MKTKLVSDAEKESLEIDEAIRKLKLRKKELDDFVYRSRTEFRLRRKEAFALSLERIKDGETMDSIGRSLGITGVSVSSRASKLYKYIAIRNGIKESEPGTSIRQKICDNWELIKDFMDRNPGWWENVKMNQ